MTKCALLDLQLHSNKRGRNFSIWNIYAGSVLRISEHMSVKGQGILHDWKWGKLENWKKWSQHNQIRYWTLFWNYDWIWCTLLQGLCVAWAYRVNLEGEASHWCSASIPSNSHMWSNSDEMLAVQNPNLLNNWISAFTGEKKKQHQYVWRARRFY